MAIAAPAEEPRFTPDAIDGRPTVRNRETGRVIEHAAPWDEDKALWLANELAANPSLARHFTWVAA